MKKIKILIVLLFIALNVSHTFSQTENSNVENPLGYFNERTEAISLAKNEKWQEAIPILESLTEHYQSDPRFVLCTRTFLLSR